MRGRRDISLYYTRQSQVELGIWKADAPENVLAASRLLKLFLVSCYGVTIRIHGLASPLLGEAITA
jgi:hypothetical protein